MKVLISGSTGLIGSALIPVLNDAGHDVRPVGQICAEIGWGRKFPGILNQIGLTVTVLKAWMRWSILPGKTSVQPRWSREKKARIFDSRVKGDPVTVRIARQSRTSPAGIGMCIGYRLLRKPRCRNR